MKLEPVETKFELIEGVNPLKQIRKALGMTQAEFAEAIGTYQQTIVRWEKGHTSPVFSMSQLKALQREIRKLRIDFQDLPDNFN